MRETDEVRRTGKPLPPLDAMDRKILGALIADATQSYAELGREVGLSAPAVHERVKRLRASSVIRETVARIDGAAVGKPLLVFVHVVSQNWGYSRALARICEMPEVEEAHSSTGDASVILKVRVADSAALEHFLRQVLALESVVATKTFVTLSTYVDRPVQAEVTTDWPEPEMPEA